ncbi:MAG: hypothetical protein AzoDbin1_05152 [Azoarcus sp.]|nr:hypothetical protein [Azoarcus sp.]
MPNNQPYGASQDEWIHFDVILGLGDALLPVVSNPNGEVSPTSSLKSIGKIPSRYDRNRRVVGIKDWPSYVTTEQDLARWAREPDYGISIRTGAVMAVDIDIDDPIAADDCKACIEAILGVEFPTRARGGSGRLLLLFRPTGGGDTGKRILSIPKEGAIELLGTGQQFIAAGTHPSGHRYEWIGGLPNDIPEVDLEELWAAATAYAQSFGGVEILSAAPSERRTARDVAMPDPVADYLDLTGLALGEEKGKILVECPWADTHTSGETGDSSTVWFKAGSGGYTHGGFRCLHAHCAGRSTDDFLDAIGYVEDVTDAFDVVPDDAPRHEMVALDGAVAEIALALTKSPEPFEIIGVAFRRNKKGVIQSPDNILRAVAAPEICSFEICYDDFRGENLIRRYTPGASALQDWRKFEEADYMNIAAVLAAKFKWDAVSHDAVRRAVHSVAQSRKIDTAQAWLRSLTWDGVPRVDRFMAEYLGTEDNEYARSIGQYLWTALAGRVLKPGLKADMMPILVGAQGVGKSTAIAALVPNPSYFKTLDFNTQRDDLVRLMNGTLVAEVSELEGLHTRSLGFIKAFLTTTSDSWVPKYQEVQTSRDRRTILIGTTNDEQFLADPTGNRRFLPVDVGKTKQIDLARISADALQLWAEGRETFLKEGLKYATAEKLSKTVVETYKINDEWATEIAVWLEAKDPSRGYPAVPDSPEGLTTKTIAWHVLGIPVNRIDKAAKNRIIAAMKSLGYSNSAVSVSPRYKRPFGREEHSLRVTRYFQYGRVILRGMTKNF